MRNPRARTLISLAAIAMLPGCQTEAEQAVHEPVEPPIASNLADSWRREIIQLPSQFAPGLGKGVEELRFAPGMYKPDEVDYWSYAFVLRFEDRVSGEAALQSILEQYYTGLITAVASSNNIQIDGPAARVVVEAAGGRRFHADVHLVDAFVTGKPLTVHMDIEVHDREAGSNVLAAVSPQNRNHTIWRSLFAVRAAIE